MMSDAYHFLTLPPYHKKDTYQVEQLMNYARTGIAKYNTLSIIEELGTHLIDIHDEDGMTLLHLACASGHLGVVQQLLRAVDVNFSGSLSVLPVDITNSFERAHSESSRERVVSPTLSSASTSGSDAMTTEEVGAHSKVTKDEFAVYHHGNSRLSTVYSVPSPWCKSRSKKGHTALHIATYKQHPVIMHELLNAGFDVETRSFNGAAPIHFAVFTGNSEVVTFLLREGRANTGVKTHSGSTPMKAAIHLGHVEIVKLLLTFGADPNLIGLTDEKAMEMAKENQQQLESRRVPYDDYD